MVCVGDALLKTKQKAGNAWYVYGASPAHPVGQSLDECTMRPVADDQGIFIMGDGSTGFEHQVLATKDEQSKARWLLESAVPEGLNNGVTYPHGDADTTPTEPAIDVRFLPVRSDFEERHHDFADACRGPEAMGISEWSVEGPRAARCVMDFVGHGASGGPEAHLADCKAQEGNALAHGSVDLIAPPLLAHLPKAPKGAGKRKKRDKF